MKHDLKDKRFSVIVTVSDVLNSLKERSIIDTLSPRDDTLRRRSSRIMSVGMISTFGKSAKKSKDDALTFDSALWV